MKPKLGQTVYLIHNGVILEDKVYALGRESFIVEGIYSRQDTGGWEWWYDGFNEAWFVSLVKAKERLIEDYKDIGLDEPYEFMKVIKIEENSYGLEFY